MIKASLRAAVRRFSPSERAHRRAANRLGPGFPRDGETYRGLTDYSLVFSSIVVGSAPKRVNLVVPDAEATRAYAGVKTALSFAAGLAELLGRPLRVVNTDPKANAREVSLARALVPPQLGGREVTLCNVGAGCITTASPEDVWIVTHWHTAHAADVACRVGSIRPERVVYFIQDYEPGFEPWSTQYALIKATYHAGFRLVVNSRPLARHLESEESLRVAAGDVIAPHLDSARLERAHQRRTAREPVGVFFYSRPSKPRNLFALGVAALRRAVRALGPEASRCRFYAAGEPHGAVPLPDGAVLEVLGQTGWDGYFELLSRVHVGLSLMYSPHPSHPPLELAISGARVVTNRFASARDDLHPHIVATDADPDALGEALATAARRAIREPLLPFLDVPPDHLGRTLEDVVEDVAAGFTQAPSRIVRARVGDLRTA